MMAVDELEQYIRNALDENNLGYSEKFIKKLLKFSDNWTKDWSNLFKSNLAHIKKSGGTINHAIENGRIVNLPIGKKLYMALLFEKQKDGYFIYDFIIGKRQER
jgi:hypothetical protein